MRLLPTMLAAAVILTVPFRAEAHPYAVTLAEVEYNPKEKTFEVALRVYPEQLERALSLAQGGKVSLDQADVDRFIIDYLSKHLAICRTEDMSPPERDKENPKPTKLRWIGKETTAKAVWLYVEVPVPDGIEGLTVRNTLLHEVNPEQVNTVNLTDGVRAATCTLSRAIPQQAVRWESKKEPLRPGGRKRLEF